MNMHRTVCLVIGVTTATLVTAEQQSERGPNRAVRQQLIERYDKNGDGQLDASERASLREAMAGRGGTAKRRAGELLRRFDRDGNGSLDEQERAALRRSLQNRRPGQKKRRPGSKKRAVNSDRSVPSFILRRFDKDRDGRLNPQERAAARQARQGRGRGDDSMRSSNRRPGGRGTIGSRFLPAGPDRTRVDQSELVRQFDRDGDGKLNSKERSTALLALSRRR